MTTTPLITPYRYETPTVTLEVMTQAAAVSQWSDCPVAHVLQFRLVMRGGNDLAEHVEIAGDLAAFWVLEQAIQTYVQAQLSQRLAVPEPVGWQPYVEAIGLTQHRLHLGPLRTITGDEVVALGALQLGDLSEVFDQITAQVRLLPVTLTPVKRQRSWRQWGAAVAGIVAAVGVATTLLPHYSSRQVSTTQSESSNQAVPSQDGVERSPATSRAVPQAAPESAPTGSPPASVEQPENRPATPPASVPEPTPAPSSTSSTTAPAKVAPQEESVPTSPSPRPATSPPPTPEASMEIAPPPVPSSASSEPESIQNSQAPAGSSDAEIAEPNAYTVQESPGATGDTANEASRSTLPSVTSATVPMPTLPERLQAAWQPPTDLTEPLVYRLEVAADGTLAAVLPENEEAAEYRDRSGIPEVGTLLLNPGESQQFRVTLAPDGSVQVQALSRDDTAQ